MSKNYLHIKKLVLISLLGASLTAFKFVLMYIPNIEVVSLLITVYTYAFGLGIGFFASMVFCTLEGIIWGFLPTWIISYYIHWGFLSLTAYILKKQKIKQPIVIALFVALITSLFGIQSTFLYYLIVGGIGKLGWEDRFVATYLSGVSFYITQTIGNFVIILLAFKPLSRFMEIMKKKYFL